jgi:hypothetical protein
MTNYWHWDATAGNTPAEMANNLGEVFFWYIPSTSQSSLLVGG